MSKLERTVTLLLIAIAAFIYCRAAFHAGTLCSDEVCAINLGRLPINQLPHWLVYDSYPILWPLVLKVYTGFFGNSDFALRILGFLMQVFMLGAIAFYSKVVSKVPYFTVCLFLFLPVTINYTSCLRAWGFGLTMMIMAYAFIRAAIANPIRNNLAGGFICSLAAVQSSYYNAVALFAIVASA